MHSLREENKYIRAEIELKEALLDEFVEEQKQLDGTPIFVDELDEEISCFDCALIYSSSQDVWLAVLTKFPKIGIKNKDMVRVYSLTRQRCLFLGTLSPLVSIEGLL